MKRGALLILVCLLAFCALGCAGPEEAPAVPTSVHDTPWCMDLGQLAQGDELYSRYCFSPTEGALWVSGLVLESGALDSTPRQVTILLFRVGVEDSIDSFSVPFREFESVDHTFTGLDDDAHYYLRVDNQTPKASGKDLHITGSLIVE